MIHRIKTWFGRLARDVFVRPKHWFSWVVGGAVALAMVIIVVPGEWVPLHDCHLATAAPHALEPQNPGPLSSLRELMWTSRQPEYRHGWPLEWLRRTSPVFEYPTDRRGVSRLSYPNAANPYRPHKISWSAPAAWMFSGPVSQWKLFALTCDSLVAIGIVCVSTVATERCLRSRTGWFRLRLRSLLIGVLILSAPLGWWKSHSSVSARELQALKILGVGQPAEFEIGTDWSIPGSHRRYEGPTWLAKLLGSRELLSFCRHVDWVQIEPNTITPEQANALRDLPYLRGLRAVGASNAPFDAKKVVSALRPLAGLREIKNAGTLMFKEDYEALLQLPQLRVVQSRGYHSLLLPQDVASLRQAHPEVALHFAVLGPTTEHEVRVRWLQSRGCVEHHAWSEVVDLSKIDASAARLEWLRPICRSVRRLKFGNRVDPAAAMAFVQACRGCRQADLGSVELVDGDLDGLGAADVTCRQGRMTREYLIEWAEARQPLWLTLRDTEITPSEAAELKEKWKYCWRFEIEQSDIVTTIKES